MDTYSLIDGPEEVDLILKSVDPGFQLNLVHVGSINILLQEHKLILCSCTLVDFILIPVGTQGSFISTSPNCVGYM